MVGASTLERNEVYEKFVILVGIALALLAAPTIAAARSKSIEFAQIADARIISPCASYDVSCSQQQLFFPPHSPSYLNNQPRKLLLPKDLKTRPSEKLLVPSDLNDRSHTSSPKLILPNDLNSQSYNTSPDLLLRSDLKNRPDKLKKKPCSPTNKKCDPRKPPPKHIYRHFHGYPYFYDYYGDQGYYIYPPLAYPHYLVSCRSARIILQNNGFRNIKLIRCGGKYHSFTARKRGAKYLVKVKASSGRIVIVRRTK